MLVFTQNPQVLWKEIPALKLCSQWPIETAARMQKCWGLGLVWGGRDSVFFSFSFWTESAFCTKLCTYLSPQSGWKTKFRCCQLVFVWGHLINDIERSAVVKNVAVVLTGITHPLLFMIMQYSTTYLCCLFVFFTFHIKIFAFLCITLAHSSLKRWVILGISWDGFSVEGSMSPFLILRKRENTQMDVTYTSLLLRNHPIWPSVPQIHTCNEMILNPVYKKCCIFWQHFNI